MSDLELQSAGSASAILTPDLVRQLRSLRVLANAFCAGDLAEPYRAPVGAADAPVLDPQAKLFAVVRLLTEHERVWVGGPEGIEGVVGRHNLQILVGRTWLFGIVAFIEIYMTARIAQRWNEGEWSALLPAGRLAKCRQVLDERRRRGQQCELLDCLQLTDKAQLLVDDEGERALLGFESKTAGKRANGNLELLRNSLAHAQDFTDGHWPQIAKLAGRVEETLAAMDALGLWTAGGGGGLRAGEILTRRPGHGLRTGAGASR